ncbi:hypothetical protein JXC34_00745, partial [Candidatus Woesearchaeota archaeon]|nr:hypothetical protein [Candidatus Woesearchaeota archaeon]
MKEEVFYCKKCKIEIGGHNQYLHDGMCDDCYFDEYFPDEFVMLPELLAENKKDIKSIFNKG